MYVQLVIAVQASDKTWLCYPKKCCCILVARELQVSKSGKLLLGTMLTIVGCLVREKHQVPQVML